mmetsp:Transcript_28598/g.42288  ORF Transcript_28598/g.42288 Transcript_28598/m.42288 type:complete len:172 (-) Transcript_28598:358-873(-)|eukprot:CAMPEP_0195515670 /NCGR_PEP_ID=MMETSP0794_2-20130614/6654_1 /TAXON_ID=515487 /ORGANISM="Stephanopyxis turris, Strain CCMP 815" /LENGTH=171 /DNA_ID=CAMNT_0040644129 /DNA_START=89 /DNA_END=604 /DNA_ORIENTATION=-
MGRQDADCVTRTFNSALLGAGVGTFAGAVQMAWTPDAVTSNKQFGGIAGQTDARAVLRGIGRPGVWFAFVGASYAFAECAAQSFRGTNDPLNAGIGGMVAGAVMGSMFRRFDIMAATGIGMGLLLAATEFGGGDVVYDSELANHKVFGTLPTSESEELSALKEKYSKFKDN